MSCLNLKNVVAHAWVFKEVLSKWPHYWGLNARTCECNDGTYHLNPFSYSIVVTGNLDVYHIFYTQSIRASMDSLVSSHTAEPPSLSGEHTPGAL